MVATASSSTPSPASPAASAARAKPVRMFGRFQLLRLVGKSDRTMGWAAVDTRSQQECLLVILRQQLDAEAASAWLQAAQRAARLQHPQLAKPLEIGVHDRWPFMAYDRSRAVSWPEKFSRQGAPAAELAGWAAQIAQGLAFAHEAGVAHRDLQPWMLAIDELQQVSVMGLEAAAHPTETQHDGGLDALRAVRDAAQQDVLALGLVMHHALVGQPALDEPDVVHVIQRMPPLGQEIVRLPWTVPRPIPEPLRAIVNRCTDRQPRLRYRSARTLQRALEGWLKTQDDDGGPLALLRDRLRTVGVLPAQPGGAERVAHLALMERGRTSELAELVLGDIALAFELLRRVNSAQLRGGQVSDDGPVLMLRRAIAMLGLDGVRQAALGLRRWPGPLDDAAAGQLDTLMRRAHRAARLAVRLVPAGYDGEVVYLISLLQNLGRMVVQYHFPEEAEQIRKLMQNDDAPATAPDAHGMSPEAASFAVLGLDLDELGVAVAQHWGLDDSVLALMRRVPPNAPVRTADSDTDNLRTTASCAGELVDALNQPATRVQAALRQVVQRYARALNLSGREMQDALQLELQGGDATGLPHGSPLPAVGESSSSGLRRQNVS
ncbi:HDOD domain-containing protein [Ideonella azotifigens]|uniref:HDOD domain-containing protein n=3 Tax=Ideonella azotifigens TaxID=513160 RepID=A0ABN1JYG3_9BURK|nr:HDOD domain-containing protein [Ideonella azotifigens]MCD2341357.1 HDOD domain-containing protein [Ideonella azotifigens]